MTNREWLNTLSDGNFVTVCMEHINPFVDLDPVNWLSQPHETTADEDFAEIGFKLIETDFEKSSSWLYRDW